MAASIVHMHVFAIGAIFDDFWPVEWGPGRMVFQGIPAKAHYNPLGSVHGGWIAAILDSAVGCAVHSTRIRTAVARRPCADAGGRREPSRGTSEYYVIPAQAGIQK